MPAFSTRFPRPTASDLLAIMAANVNATAGVDLGLYEPQTPQGRPDTTWDDDWETEHCPECDGIGLAHDTDCSYFVEA